MWGPGARTPGTPGVQQICTLSMWGPGARMTGTPGGQQMNTFVSGPEARPYGKDPGRSTHVHLYVGPRTPYARDLGKSTNTHLCGARGPVGQGPRDIKPWSIYLLYVCIPCPMWTTTCVQVCFYILTAAQVRKPLGSSADAIWGPQGPTVLLGRFWSWLLWGRG